MLAERTGAAILLAAGFSRRFGTDKRQFTLDDGQPMLPATIATYLAVFEFLTVVMRPEDTALAAQISGCNIVYAGDAHLGMGHSLSAGMRSLLPVDFAFIGLADMPFIATSTLQQLIDCMGQLDDDAIVQPFYRDTPGHPVGFGRAHFDALSNLTGDVGAKTVVQTHGAQLRAVKIDDAGVVRDLDVPP
ncbi:MAG: nucleotidyltransferase family protein [Gammaproteobacteria bacterium]|nr:nucleotidyltransferase family protein [Gammaproteobacteria bacterium]